MAATIGIGETVEVHWPDGRQFLGIIEDVEYGAAKIRLPGPPEITIIVPVARLAEAGAHHWTLDADD